MIKIGYWPIVVGLAAGAIFGTYLALRTPNTDFNIKQQFAKIPVEALPGEIATLTTMLHCTDLNLQGWSFETSPNPDNLELKDSYAQTLRTGGLLPGPQTYPALERLCNGGEYQITLANDAKLFRVNLVPGKSPFFLLGMRTTDPALRDYQPKFSSGDHLFLDSNHNGRIDLALHQDGRTGECTGFGLDASLFHFFATNPENTDPKILRQSIPQEVYAGILNQIAVNLPSQNVKCRGGIDL